MRLIDADELIKQIQTTYCRDCKDCNKDKDFFHCRIEQIIGDIHYAPTVDLWHYPSKGEYPTEDGFYFVTCDPHFEGGHRFVCMCSYASTENRWIDSRGYTEHCVIAWMPLPEPPKEKK